MLVRSHATRVSATLRQEINGVRRVMVARRDGLAFHDDVDREQSTAAEEAAAAVAAALLGIAEHVSRASEHGELQSTIVRSDQGCLIVYGAGEEYVLGIYTDPTVNLNLLDRVARRVVGEIQAA